MQAEIIAIGDELTSGQRIDTNSAWLSQQLEQLGIRVMQHGTVADDLASCQSAIREALDRTDLLVCTGGLGPTSDDLTRPAIAGALQVKLEQSDAALQHIRNIFERRGRKMPPQNAVQAQFPSGSRMIPNPNGTAPGIDMDAPRSQSPGQFCRCFALPGVPAEMKEMWYGTVLPALRQSGFSQGVIHHHELKCFGIGESECERRLPDLFRRGRNPSVGITVHKATITIRITAKGIDQAECRRQIEPTARAIRQTLGTLIFAEGDVTLPEVVLKELGKRQLSLTTVEWATTGILAHWLASSGATATGQRVNAPDSTYRGGTIHTVPDSTDGQRLVDIVQAQRKLFQADFGLGIGPWYVPAPDGDLPALPKTDSGELRETGATPCAKIVLTCKTGPTQMRDVAYAGHPEIILERTAKLALDMLRHFLLDTFPVRER